MRSLVVVALLVASCKAGCKKEKAATAPSPKPPASTDAQDALWKLAPDGATVGVVMSPAGIAAFENGWLAVKKLFATAPELAPAAAKLNAELTKDFGSANVRLADVGMAPGKGAALFVLAKGEELVITPVVDRDKFLAVTKGTKGADADTVDDYTCKTVQGFYTCAKPAAVLERIGKAPMGDRIKLAGARGDIEVAVAIDKSGTSINIAAVGQLDDGAITVRGAVQGVPAQVTSKLVAHQGPAMDPQHTAGFAILNVGPALAGVPLPPMPIVPGVTIAELAGTIRDPQTIAIPPGALTFDVRVPLSDPVPAQKLVEQCAALPMLKMMGATVTNGVCHLPIPQLSTALDLWIENKQLRVGTKGKAPSAIAIAPSPIASELLKGEWAFAMYGRGTLLGEAQLPPMPFSQMPEQAKIGIRLMMLLNELGFGVRADGDTIRFIASVRTAWSNPDDVVAKLVAIPPEDVLAGKAAATAKQIAAASPSSPFATDFKAGIGGLMIPSGTIGMLAAVAIPAFMDYMKKSKKTEASLHLGALERHLKAAAAADGALPKGEAPLTPATSCCDSPDHKCSDSAAWQHPVWQTLEFSIDDPHLFRYSYESDGKTFKATAVGDLDCDGIEIAYVLAGSVDADGKVTAELTPPQPNTD